MQRLAHGAEHRSKSGGLSGRNAERRGRGLGVQIEQSSGG
jgi:hypothetical protein